MSNAVTAASTYVVPASTVTVVAPTVMDGAVVSTTLIEKVFKPVRPAPSVAEHVTLVVPTANRLPDTGEQVLAMLVPRSVAEDVNVTTAPPSAFPSIVAAGAVTVTTGG